jgi:hypothetical protein
MTEVDAKAWRDRLMLERSSRLGKSGGFSRSRSLSRFEPLGRQIADCLEMDDLGHAIGHGNSPCTGHTHAIDPVFRTRVSFRSEHWLIML